MITLQGFAEKVSFENQIIEKNGTKTISNQITTSGYVTESFLHKATEKRKNSEFKASSLVHSCDPIEKEERISTESFGDMFLENPNCYISSNKNAVANAAESATDCMIRSINVSSNREFIIPSKTPCSKLDHRCAISEQYDREPSLIESMKRTLGIKFNMAIPNMLGHTTSEANRRFSLFSSTSEDKYLYLCCSLVYLDDQPQIQDMEHDKGY